MPNRCCPFIYTLVKLGTEVTHFFVSALIESCYSWPFCLMQIFSHSLLFQQEYSFRINELSSFVLVDNGYILACVFGSTSVHCQTWWIITIWCGQPILKHIVTSQLQWSLYSVHNSPPPLDPILRHMNQIHTITYYLCLF
jgi:hypothetical protein